MKLRLKLFCPTEKIRSITSLVVWMEDSTCASTQKHYINPDSDRALAQFFVRNMDQRRTLALSQLFMHMKDHRLLPDDDQFNLLKSNLERFSLVHSHSTNSNSSYQPVEFKVLVVTKSKEDRTPAEYCVYCAGPSEDILDTGGDKSTYVLIRFLCHGIDNEEQYQWAKFFRRLLELQNSLTPILSSDLFTQPKLFHNTPQIL